MLHLKNLCFLIIGIAFMLNIGTAQGAMAITEVENSHNTSTTTAENFAKLNPALPLVDLPNKASLDKKITAIRANFKRINAIQHWSKLTIRALQETIEGGEARFYYSEGELEKIVTKQYAESFQLLTEYYLLEGQLSFVFEKKYLYNRPFYQDAALTQEIGDTEAFDFDKSTIIKVRNYFANKQLIHQIHSQEADVLLSEQYRHSEFERIQSDYNNLIKKVN